MDIMMRNVPWAATDADVTIAVAGLLHSDTMQPHIPREIVLPLNFRVFLHPKRPNHDPKRGQTGILTVPAASIGAELLRLVSHVFPILVHNRRVWFSRSVKEMRPGVVEELRRTPFVDPFQAKAMEQKQAQLQDDVRVHTLQFGRRCRDDVFSSEWEHRYVGNEKCSLRFQDATTELYIQGELVGKNAHAVVIRYSNIETIEVDNRPEEPSILFSLNVPPAFEEVDPTEKKSRKRTTYLGDPTLEHALVAPFTSTVVRLVCRSIDDLASFKHMSKVARLRKSQKTDLMIERRHLFSTFNMQLVERWLRSLDWGVAFQCASLLQSSLLDAVELLQCRHDIAKLPSTDVARNVYVLRCFGTNLKTFLGDDERESAVQDPVAECFAAADASVPSTYSARQVATDDLFACLHVTFTPTRIILHGPEPDQSNRVLRLYPRNQDCFLRVHFTDEARLQYRWDRDVDGDSFIKERVGGILHNGFNIAGKHFDFLAYSSASLKEHCVWFCTPFRVPGKGLITAQSILAGLGNFDRVIYCPARYGARISQAFSATDPSIAITAEELIPINDIKIGESLFTDGIGTMSREIADDIWDALARLRGGKRQRRSIQAPSAYQVRIGGYKGMLSVDHELEGPVICVRESMDKFDAPHSLDIEIAGYFDKPGPMFLNRPLIAILETLGVPPSAFMELQQKALKETEEALSSIGSSAQLLERHGLGSSFRLPGLLHSLHKLGLHFRDLGDPFLMQTIRYGIMDIKRELKHRARIPVDGGWTLVGIADIHDFLREGEIFACLKEGKGRSRYVGPGYVLVSRSPTMHPGDVQMVWAIGAPPLGSPFTHDEFPNCLVFPSQAPISMRSLPSCLGGGDLDGDLYNIITLPALHPERCVVPAAYTPAVKKTTDYPCTIHDVADFIVDFINSDIIGLIAIQHLIISDQSPKGVEDPRCILLAELHSDAVDFPKSGTPVPLGKVPKLLLKIKPDWSAGEMSSDTAKFHKSAKALGQLYRAVQLTDPHGKDDPKSRGISKVDVDRLLRSMDASVRRRRNPISSRLRGIVGRYVDMDYTDDMLQAAKAQFVQYEMELRHICASHNLSQKPLKEAEAFVGTITAKSSQPRRRRDLIAQMRTSTADLVKRVRADLTGDDWDDDYDCLLRSWVAWECSVSLDDVFGAKSFGWVALASIFEALKALEG